MNRSEILLLLFFILFLFGSSAGAIDPNERDTIWIDSVTAYPSGQAVLPIYFFNDEPLTLISIVLRHDDNFLVVDSFSLSGGRLDGFPDLITFLNDSADVVQFSAYVNLISAEEDIPVGNGMLGNFYFSVDPSAAGSTIPIDTTTWFLLGGGTKSTLFTYPPGFTLKPQFEMGYITVLEAPPSNDSAWVDSVVAGPGDQVAIGIYGKNEEDLSKIDLSLSYFSDNLTFVDVIFDQSRSLSAQKVEEANQGMGHIHIGLDFGDSSPLTPGSGLLATVIFDVSASSPDVLTIIDSTSYLGPTGQSLEFHQTAAAGGQSFAPYFDRGFIDIKSVTDIDEDDIITLPKEYLLAQNSPNPFNPSTKIQFQLPKTDHVKLTVYNVLGQVVRKLFDEKLEAGSHSIIFDGKDNNGGDIASGIYFYRLEASGFTKSKKMMLLK